MDLKFEQYVPTNNESFRGRVAPTEPKATISKSGQIRFNRVVRDRLYLVGGSYVTLHHCPDANIIGVAKAKKGDPGALKIGEYKGNDDLHLAFGGAMKVFNIKKETQSLLDVTKNEENGMVLIHGVKQQPKNIAMIQPVRPAAQS